MANNWICIPNRHKEMAPFFFLCLSHFTVERRSSYPYITGDTWRFLCDWRLTENETFEPEQIQKGDTIFVEYQLLEEFEKIVSQIQHPFILITPNVENYSDGPLPGRFAHLLKNKKMAGWFVQNIDRPASRRLIPIPIGLPNDIWKQDLVEPKVGNRDIFVYLNFNLDTNPQQRRPCLDYFAKMPWAYQAAPQTFQQYCEDLSRSVFVVSPPGSGLDCHRTWEALCLGCYPIVLSSTLNPLYKGLPVVVVQSWEEVSEELLHKKKEEFDELFLEKGIHSPATTGRQASCCSSTTQKRKNGLSKMYMPYWVEKVDQIRKKL